MGFFDAIFGSSITKALREGAIIIDVRNGTEYDHGHVPDAFNIPVDRVSDSAERLKKTGKPIIVCCSSGDRSALAVRTLKQAGLKKVYNAGNWQRLLKTIEKNA